MTVAPVVTCRVCGHDAPSRDMTDHPRMRVFDWQPRETPADQRWICRDAQACFLRFLGGQP